MDPYKTSQIAHGLRDFWITLYYFKTAEAKNSEVGAKPISQPWTIKG
jgi:hypothetical protein